jgi:hypothetical protein
MKNYFLIISLAMIVTSCKKNYVCECYVLTETEPQTSEIIHDTKKNAKRKCEAEWAIDKSCRLK